MYSLRKKSPVNAGAKNKHKNLAGWDGFWVRFQSIGECPLSDVYPLTEPDLINPYISE